MDRLTLKKNAGFTLVEITLVLSVLAVLALVLTPAVMNFINDARLARAQSDLQTLSGSLVEFYRTTGFFPKTMDSVAGGPGGAQVDMLVSNGNTPRAGDTGGDATRWIVGSADRYENHLMNNGAGYRMRNGANDYGWSGPYVNGSIESDPWGNRYMMNVVYLDANLGPLSAEGYQKSSVMALSAGPDGIVDTPFTQAIGQSASFGDDLSYRVQ